MKFERITITVCLKYSILALFAGWIVPCFGQADQLQSIDQIIDRSKDLAGDGAFENAIDLLQKTVKGQQTKPHTDSLALARIHHQLGRLFYQFGESDSLLQLSLDHIQKALVIRERQESSTPLLLYQSYYMQAILYQYVMDYEKAIASGQAAVKKLEEIADPDNNYRLAKTYLLISISFEEMGEQDAALSYGKQALQIFEALEHKTQIIKTKNQLGLVCKALKKYSLAIDYFKQILAIPDIEASDAADAFNNLGLVYKEVGQQREAIAAFQKAEKINRTLYRQEQSPDLHLAIAGNLENIGIEYTKMGQFAKAKSYLQQARKIYQAERQTKFHFDMASVNDNLGDLYFAQSDYQQALQYYQTGITCLVPGFENKSLDHNPDLTRHSCNDKITLLTLLRSKARSFSQIYQQHPEDQIPLLQAYHCYQNIDTLISQIRQHFKSENSRYALIEQVIPTYEKAIQNALLLYKKNGAKKYLEEAYHFCIKNKAIVLLENLQEENAKYAGIPDQLLLREQDLKRAYIEAETALYDLEKDHSTTSEDLLKEVHFKAKRNYDELIRQLEKDYPRYYDLKYAYAQKTDILTLQNKLPEEALLIEYFIGAEQIFIFTLSRDHLQYFQSDKVAGFETACLNFRNLSSAITLDQAKQKRFDELAFQLYDWLLAAALQSAEKSRMVERLFIVPDGPLLLISFDNLFYQPLKKERPYLIKKYATSIAYSSKLFFEDTGKEQGRKASKNFGGFGLEYDAPSLAALNQWLNGPATGAANQSLAGKLIFSPKEVTSSAQLFGGDYWIDEAATKKLFLEKADQYKIVHLATHGLAVRDKPLNSALAFSWSAADRDFLLRAADIYPLRLNAELVTLSACDTGHGKLSKGEGIQSLARAFSYAGSPSILASLWHASDAPNNEILIPFYQNLKEGQAKDIALRQAKLQYLANNSTYAAPVYWANMTLIGSPKPLQIRVVSAFWAYGLTAGLCCLFFGWLYFRN